MRVSRMHLKKLVNQNFQRKNLEKLLDKSMLWVVLSIKAVLCSQVFVAFISTINTRIWHTVALSVKTSVLGMGR